LAQIKMKRVVAPDPGAWLFDQDVTPATEGIGDIDYVCAGCDAVMLKNVTIYAMGPGFVWKCPHCGTYSQIAGA